MNPVITVFIGISFLVTVFLLLTMLILADIYRELRGIRRAMEARNKKDGIQP